VDLPASRHSGLIEIQSILKGVPGITFVYFDESDVVRHRLVSAIIRAYGAHEARVRAHMRPADGPAAAAPGAEDEATAADS
jgi:phosphate starvation-inducible PhoH-like protein